MTPLEIDQLLHALEPGLQSAYLDQVQQTSEDALVSDIADAVSSGFIAEIIRLIGIGAFLALLEAIRTAYLKAGKIEATGIKIVKIDGLKVRPQINMQSPRTAEWLQQNAGQFLSSMAAERQGAVQAMVNAGIALKESPNTIALNIVGRRDAQTGKRVGGVIGLTEQQAQYVANARAQLLSGDAAQLKQYLTRGRRDLRFDGIVKRAIDAGKSVAKADVDKITGRYAANLLTTRALNIAKANSLMAVGAARDEVYRQMIDYGFTAGTITKTWKSRGDENVRHSHKELNGTKVGFDQTFISELGSPMRFPGDVSLGASMSDIMGCRCAAIYKVKFG